MNTAPDSSQGLTIDEELKVAHRIQLGLLPDSCPAIPGWDFCTLYQAARQVSGDFYDFLTFDDDPDKLGLVIADAVDKGVPAALFMAMSRATIRATACSYLGPAETLTRTNRLLRQASREEFFLTAFYGTLNLNSGRLTYTNAGHNHPLWVRCAAGEVSELGSNGTALAILDDIRLEDYVVEIGPGDSVIFYTDGVTEARNAAGEEFGVERLMEAARTHAHQDSTAILRAVVDAACAFSGDTPPADDFTCFVIQRTAE